MTAVSFTFEEGQKEAFARANLRLNDSFKAALEVFGEKNIGKVAYVSQEWPTDIEVQAISARLTQKGITSDLLPTKETVLLELWNKAKGAPLDDFTKAVKMMAEISGWIIKPDNNFNIQNNVVSNVMMVKDHGTNDDWEAKARKQQADLTRRDDEPQSIH